MDPSHKTPKPLPYLCDSSSMDPVQDLPESVVTVQSLAESGVTTIPDCYVKPPSERPSIDPAPELLNIPIIDLGDGALSSDTVAAMSEACREWGFFQVVNHGVKPELLKALREAWRGFFHLPLEEKKKYANNPPKTFEGYGSRLGVDKEADLDWRDFFFLGTVFPESGRVLDKWPTNPATLREITEECCRGAEKMGRMLLKLLSLSLGLEEGTMQKVFGGEKANTVFHANLFPKCPQPDLSIGLSPHTDPGGFTILLADDRVKGLQVRKDNTWVTVQPAPDAFIVNVGDLIQIVSNKIYKSMEHRVITNAAEERISLVFVYGPDRDVPIGPPSELVTPDRPSLYKPITQNEYMMKRGMDGKLHVDSLEVM